jgi:putative DNA methylase
VKPVLLDTGVLSFYLKGCDEGVVALCVFLKLLTMDDAGLWRRKTKPIALKDVYALLGPAERRDWFRPDADPARPKLRAGLEPADRERLQKLVFERLSYDDKLGYCDRPEQVPGPDADAWAAINAHLGTAADSLPALVRVLGERRFGHVPTVGDAFCGGGSVPFEAARIGCNAVGSDLNPVAALLTWAALHIVGGGPAVAARVREAQQRVFAAVDRQITDWRIEHNAAMRRSRGHMGEMRS